MKHLLIGLIGITFLSCGAETEELVVENQADTLETVIEEKAEELTEETYIPENLDGNWQVDDYAEMLIGEPVALKAEDANMDNAMGWYYQELDLAGGFASVTGAIEGWQEIVIWRMADGDDLVGFMSVGCGPACDYYFEFYKGQGKEIKQIEYTEILPIQEIENMLTERHQEILNREIEIGFDYPEDVQVYYRFPKKGTSMEVDIIVGADELQEPLLKLSWNKSKFSIEKKY